MPNSDWRVVTGTRFVDDVGAERDRVVSAGFTLADDLADQAWGLTDFRLTDPDGYYWRFTSRA